MGYTQAPLVMNVPNLTPTQKLVLMAITLRANEEHDDCMWASQSTLAAECSTTRETVNATVKLLEERGLLSRMPRFRPKAGGGRIRTTDAIRVHYAALQAAAGVDSAHSAAVNSDHRGCDVRPQLNREANQEITTSAAAPHARAASTARAAGTPAAPRKPRRKHTEHAQRVLDNTRARSLHGVADIITWAVTEHELSPDDAVEHLIALGSNGQPVTLAALAARLAARVPAAAAPVDPEEGARAAARAHRLRVLAGEHPELAAGVALLAEASEQREVKCTRYEAERVQEELRGLTSRPFTAEDVAAAARAAAEDGELVTPHSVEKHLRRRPSSSQWNVPEEDLSWL